MLSEVIIGEFSIQNTGWSPYRNANERLVDRILSLSAFWLVHSLTVYDKILNMSTFKAFADDIINMT